MSELGDFLKKLRGELSLREAAKRSGLSYSYISSLESGKHPRTGVTITPSPDTLKALSSAYNYDYEELMKKAGHLPSEGEKKSISITPDSGMAFYGGGRDWTEEEIEMAEAVIEAHRARKKQKEEEAKKKK